MYSRSTIGVAIPSHERISSIQRKFLLLVTGLLMWGLPSIRFAPRPAEDAFNGSIDATVLFQISVCIAGIIAAAIGCASRARRGLPLFPVVLFRGPNAAFMAYGALAMSSAIYSVNTAFTLYSASKILLLFICSALLMANRRGGSCGIASCLRLFYIVNILQWAAIAVLFIFDPALVGEIDPKVGYRLNGGSFDDYGRAAAFSGLLLLIIAIQSRGARRLYSLAGYAVSWAFVLLSLTRGTTICAVLTGCLTLLGRYRARARVVLVCLSIMLLSAIVVSGTLDRIVDIGMRGQTRAELESLSGRSQAFDYVIRGWEQSLWLGFGYGAGNRYLLLHFQQESGLGIGAAHDCLSRVLADLGLVGATVLLVACIHLLIAACTMWRRAKEHGETRDLALQILALLVHTIIFSVISPGAAEVGAPLVITALATVALRERKLRSRRVRTYAGLFGPRLYQQSAQAA